MVERIGFYVKKAWAPTVVVTIVFFLQYFIFGQENTTIAPFMALTFLRLEGKEAYRGCLIRNFGIYTVMAICGYLALLHPVSNVVVNAFALFWIGYFLIDEFQPNNYFPAGMALLFFQISPAAGIAKLGMRIAALAASFAVVWIFIAILHKLTSRKTISSWVEDGLCEIEHLYAALEKEDEETVKVQQEKILKINRSLCNLIYHDNRSEIGSEVRSNRYCMFIWSFRRIVSFSDLWLEKKDPIYIERLGILRSDCECVYRQLGESGEVEARFKPYVSVKRLKLRVNKPDIRSFRLRFALRQMCIMVPCMFFGYMVQLPNRYWLAISVFFMMIPLYERTFGRIAERMKGTFAGLTVCVVLFAIFHTVPTRIAVMTVFNFLIYCSGSYTAMVTCITCSALALNFSDQNYLIILAWRMGYTIIGALIAWIGNTWVFPIRATKQMDYLKECFDNIYKKRVEVEDLPEEERVPWINHLLIRAYLFANRLEDLNQALPQEKQYSECKAYLKEFFDRFMSVGKTLY